MTGGSALIPLGLCQCGCGATTTISAKTDRKYGWIKGHPKLFVVGHGNTYRRLALVQPEEYRLVPLTNGAVAKVSTEDFTRVSQHRWLLLATGYAAAHLSGHKIITMHRFILQPSEGEQIDHRNRDRLDNRRENLRTCTQSQNMANRSKGQYKGVSRHGKSWRAELTVNGERIRIGRLASVEQAAAAYNVLAQKHFGEFALLNDV